MITQNRLMEVLDYDPSTGVFTWRRRMANNVMPGARAGWNTHGGYSLIRVDGRTYRASHLAWLYVTGHWPHHQIDHANCVPSDNRFCNLREATQSQNNHNQRQKRPDQLKGVTKIGRRYYARIRIDGETTHLGGYATAEEAHAAYMEVAKSFYGEFARAS